MEPTGGITEAAAVASAIAAGLVLGVQKAWKVWGDSRTDHSKSAAQVEVIDQLREELVRMSVQNTKLADCLNTLQLEVINLRGENAELRTTIRHLNSEVRALRKSGSHSGFTPLDEPQKGD